MRMYLRKERRKMTNRTKIIIALAVIVVIIGIIFGVVKNNKKTENTSANQDAFGDMIDYYEENNNVEENILEENENTETENNLVEENTIIEENTTKNETSNINNSNANTATVVGKEEEESRQENTTANDKNTAIELAKKEWGISVNSYDYDAELQSDGTYIVTVRGKNDRNAVTSYVVDVKAGTATER